MSNTAIREILALWRLAHAETASADRLVASDLVARDRFTNLMRRRGWHRYYGGFKAALIKGSLVAKFAYDAGDDEHTKHEWNIWKRSPPFKRRFLARCYAYENGLLIQENHGDECGDFDCPSAMRYAHRFRICDWGKNHAHRPASGLPVFFDYDNSGSGWDAWRQKALRRRAA